MPQTRWYPCGVVITGIPRGNIRPGRGTRAEILEQTKSRSPDEGWTPELYRPLVDGLESIMNGGYDQQFLIAVCNKGHYNIHHRRKQMS